jgi:hypothetical protein
MRTGVSGIRLALAVALLVLGVAALAATFMAAQPANRDGLSDRFAYDIEQFKKTDPALIAYRELPGVKLNLAEPRAVAMGPDDRLYVAGDRQIAVYDAAGSELETIALEAEPRSLAVATADHAQPGRIYVGFNDHVEVYTAGKRQAVWPSFGPQAVLTAIAVAPENIFVADAGNRIVWRCDLAGGVEGRIGDRDPDRGISGFFIPSPYFDLAIAPDGLLRVVNPAAHRIEAYTFDGYVETHWGKASLAIDGFGGCCNPANIAMLPDGRLVTAEKGVPRVKVYDAEGHFLHVVVGPESLTSTATSVEETRSEHRSDVVDVAVDSRQRVLVLDPNARAVRVFELIEDVVENDAADQAASDGVANQP